VEIRRDPPKTMKQKLTPEERKKYLLELYRNNDKKFGEAFYRHFVLIKKENKNVEIIKKEPLETPATTATKEFVPLDAEISLFTAPL